MNENDFSTFVLRTALSAILSSSLVALIAGLVVHRRTEQIKGQVRQQIEEALLRSRSIRMWQEQSLSELLGPVAMQLARTEQAFARWTQRNLYLESSIIAVGNRTIRDLLLAKGHLIPRELLPDATALIEHYDRWLEEFDRIRGGATPDPGAPFVFVGPEGYPFPRSAALRFSAAADDTWRALYGTGPRARGSEARAPQRGMTLDAIRRWSRSGRPRRAYPAMTELPIEDAHGVAVRLGASEEPRGHCFRDVRDTEQWHDLADGELAHEPDVDRPGGDLVHLLIHGAQDLLLAPQRADRVSIAG
jgi:hypothetical protein